MLSANVNPSKRMYFDASKATKKAVKAENAAKAENQPHFFGSDFLIKEIGIEIGLLYIFDTE